MASSALSAPIGASSSGNIDNNSVTRRAALGALAAFPTVGVGAITTLAAIPHAALAAPRTERWDHLHARWLRISESADRFWTTHYAPKRKRIDAFTGMEPQLWFDHTARSGHVARIRVDPKGGHILPCYREQSEAIAAKWRAWRERERQADASQPWRSIADRMDRLWDLEHAARAALMNEPAPDAPALALKVQLAMGNNELWDADRAALIADAARMVA